MYKLHEQEGKRGTGLMQWVQCIIKTTSEDVDILCAKLLDHGIEGLEIIDPTEAARYLESRPSDWDYAEPPVYEGLSGNQAQICFHIPAEDEGRIHKLASAFELETKLVEDSWLTIWKECYKPFSIAKGVVVVPVWEEYEQQDDEVVFKIEPGSAFGTGLHQSTALCVQALADNKPRGNVLDIGSGSGILAIIALLLGADEGWAIDIDSEAMKVCLNNAEINGVAARLHCIKGNVLADRSIVDSLRARKYKVIMANIIADVVIELAPMVKTMLDDGGVFIAGGIIKDRRRDVELALSHAGFSRLEVRHEDEWVAIICHA